MLIGAHMSISKGLTQAIKDSLSIQGTTMQIFTRNPRGGKAKKIDPKDIEKSREVIEKHNFGPWVAHAPYTINLCSKKPEVRKFGIETIKDDFERMKIMGAGFMVVHAGSHNGQGEDIGEKLLIDALNQLLPDCPQSMYLLIEVMAGQGTEIGYKLDRIQKIIDSVEDNKQLGICLDTCHLFGSGYGVEKWDIFWREIQSIVAVERIKVLHLNDSKFPKGSRKDRHSPLGQGEIGLENIKELLLHPSVKNLPIILETPLDLEGWAKEIKVIKEWWKEAGLI